MLMISLAKIGRRTFVMIGVVAFSCGATYYVTDKSKEARIAELQDQIDSLNNHMLQARVNQRISEQMGDIASEQSLVAIQERDRAEKQSMIADRERDHAEKERGLALEAQNQALASAKEARRQQAIAEEQREKATRNMIIAQKARAQADTLLYSSLTNTLAQSSMVQLSLGKTDLANLLSYASWYYTKTYRPDLMYQSTLFGALIYSSGAMYYKDTVKGNIRKLHVVEDGSVVGVSDYGEVFVADTAQTILGSFGQSYNILDFYTYGKKRNVALCSDGRLIQFDASDLSSFISKPQMIKHELRLQLPKGFWKRIIGINHGETLVAMADNMVAWIDGNTLQLKGKAKVSSKTTAIGKQGRILQIFCEDGSHYISNEASQLIPLELTTISNKEKITCYQYNKEMKLTFLGTEKGKVLVYDDNGENLHEFFMDEGAVTDIHVWDNLLGVTSYGKRFLLWDLSDLDSNILPVSLGVAPWPLCFDIDKKSKNVWIGMADGGVVRIGSSMEANAAKTRNNLTRNFTEQEWNTFIGKDIPKVNFLSR